MNPSASPKPDWIDFKTAAGAIPAARPSAMLDISIARNACSFTTRIRNSSSTMDATVRTSRPGPATGMNRLFYNARANPPCPRLLS